MWVAVDCFWKQTLSSRVMRGTTKVNQKEPSDCQDEEDKKIGVGEEQMLKQYVCDFMSLLQQTAAQYFLKWLSYHSKYKRENGATLSCFLVFSKEIR